MTKKNVDLINEGVVRRWGKLANLNKLTESFLDSTEVVAEEEEELEVELPADESEDLAAAEPEMETELDAEMAETPEAPMDEDQVEALTVAFAAALSQVTGVDVAVEADGGEEMPADELEPELEAPALDAEAELPADELEPELGDEEVAFNRTDDEEETEEEATPVTEAEEATDTDDEEETKTDDTELTEAVLRRVINRLLATKK